MAPVRLLEPCDMAPILCCEDTTTHEADTFEIERHANGVTPGKVHLRTLGCSRESPSTSKHNFHFSQNVFLSHLPSLVSWTPTGAELVVEARAAQQLPRLPSLGSAYASRRCNAANEGISGQCAAPQQCSSARHHSFGFGMNGRFDPGHLSSGSGNAPNSVGASSKMMHAAMMAGSGMSNSCSTDTNGTSMGLYSAESSLSFNDGDDLGPSVSQLQTQPSPRPRPPAAEHGTYKSSIQRPSPAVAPVHPGAKKNLHMQLKPMPLFGSRSAGKRIRLAPVSQVRKVSLGDAAHVRCLTSACWPTRGEQEDGPTMEHTLESDLSGGSTGGSAFLRGLQADMEGKLAGGYAHLLPSADLSPDV